MKHIQVGQGVVLVRTQALFWDRREKKKVKKNNKKTKQKQKNTLP
jgi:hypothetical protein